MTAHDFAISAFAAACLTGPAFGQSPKVDFARDVQPIFRQNCIGCHGPALATNGLRLDRKSSVLKDGARRVVPGSSENSFLYHRLVSTEYGLQMPPTGALKPEQIAIIKTWIEQGAEWPDSLSKEAERVPLDPKAVAAVETLRSGDEQGFLKALSADGRLVNARGPEGSTPFMYAALYGDAAMLEQQLKQGADPNRKNDAGATALMWAATNLDKTRVMLAHDASVNAISDDLRTPLMIAAGMPAGTPIVKLLLEHGANVNPTKRPDSESSPLIQAALASNVETMKLLLEHGADLKASAVGALVFSLMQDCRECVDYLLKQNLDSDVYTITLGAVVNFAGVNTVRILLDRGAKVDAPDPLGHTPLANAASSDSVPTEVVKLLIERGANVNAKSSHLNSGDTGMSVLDLARLRGDTPVVDVLVKAGAKSAAAGVPAPKPGPAVSVRAAIERSLPLLQRADVGFSSKSGCVSCHSESLAATAMGMARARGFRVDETASEKQRKFNVESLQHQRDLLHQGYSGGGPLIDVFDAHILAYILIGFHAEGYPADLDTDAAVMYIKGRQMPDGSWPYPPSDTRPPLCSDHIGQTALALRALQLYAPIAHKAEYERSVGLASAWLAKVDAKTTEDQLGKLLGLAWAGRDAEAISKAKRELIALQRADGGWADLPSMPSNAYATGKALVALEAGGLAVSDAPYRNGTEFLLKNQMADGSWFVRTRALGFQPYFETGFPHGVHQFMSDAATGWATMALILASPPAAGKVEATAAVRKN
jgi:ankyrin repeat protein